MITEIDEAIDAAIDAALAMDRNTPGVRRLCQELLAKVTGKEINHDYPPFVPLSGYEQIGRRGNPWGRKGKPKGR